MKNNIGTIAGKEFHRFFGDRRMILSLIMPALILYLMYSLVMPRIISAATAQSKTPTLYTVNLPSELKSGLSAMKVKLTEGSDADESAFRQKLDGDKDAVLMIFPADFSSAVKSYDVSSGLPAPNVEIFYNSSSDTAGRLFGGLTAALDKYESAMSNKFDINRDINADIATSKDTTGRVFSMLMPMLLMIFLFTGCMSFAPDSIAGEKERGTIATMLVTPINRYEIVIGKIIAFAVIAVISGGLTFAAVAASLPNLVSGAADAASKMTFTGYGAADYVALLFLILSTVLLMISVVSLMSAYAKTTKEAASLVMPILLIVMLVSLMSMQSNGASLSTALYLIPFYNSVQSMIGIFAYSYSPLNILISVLSNLVYSALVVFAVTKMFNNERAMFSK